MLRIKDQNANIQLRGVEEERETKRGKGSHKTSGPIRLVGTATFPR